jgi:hypothetical protein
MVIDKSGRKNGDAGRAREERGAREQVITIPLALIVDITSVVANAEHGG